MITITIQMPCKNRWNAARNAWEIEADTRQVEKAMQSFEGREYQATLVLTEVKK